MTEITIAQFLCSQVAVLMIALFKGAFGAGMALVGIPVMSLALDPITAGTIIAPLFIPMDLIALRLYPPRTWSWPDLRVLVPSLAAGIALGYALLAVLDQRVVAVLIAVVTLAFAANWYIGGQVVSKMPRNDWWAALSGSTSGIATMIAHSVSPPLTVYLLRLGLTKDVYIGTVTIYFAIGNFLKLWPWLLLGKPTATTWTLIAMCVPTAILGVWGGWLLNRRLDQRRLYQWCYAVLVVTSIKLLWDGLRGYLI